MKDAANAKKEVSSSIADPSHQLFSTQNPSAPSNKTPASRPSTSEDPKDKFLNLLTYKIHALGDYVQTIWLFGTTDSYSTQIVKHQFICI